MGRLHNRGKDTAWFHWYDKYLKCPEYRAKRAEKLENYPVCEKCGSSNRLEVHHLNYDNLFNEDIHNDLETQCYPCHIATHIEPETKYEIK